MRWDGLFADLEAQAEALDQAERAAEIEDRTRSEVARLTLVDRLRGSLDGEVRLLCRGNATLQGRVRRVHPEWMLLDQPHGRESLVSVGAILAVSGLGRTAITAAGGASLDARLGLRFALRRIARDRSGVRVQLIDGALAGTIDRVGADYLELAVHPQGEARRRTAVFEVSLIPLAGMVAISRDADY